MATTCEVIMAISRITFSSVLPLLLGVGLQLGIMSEAGNAQAAGNSSLSPQLPLPASSSASSSSSRTGATTPAGGPIIVPRDSSELRIEPGDLLSVNVYDTPEFSNSYR